MPAHHHGAGAIASAAHMKHGHGHQVDAVGPHAPCFAKLARERHVGIGEHDAFGQAGGTRRVHQQCHIVGLTHMTWIFL